MIYIVLVLGIKIFLYAYMKMIGEKMFNAAEFFFFFANNIQNVFAKCLFEHFQ